MQSLTPARVRDVRRISQRRLLFSLLFGLVVALASAANDMQHILVTGGNSGIGLALCKRLVTERGCYVYLGSRSAERGAAALKTITDAFPDTASKLEMVQLDVTDDKSVAAAAQALKAKGVTLYALVNNAGMGLAHGDCGGAEAIVNTNYLGPKRVTEAMVDLIDPKVGRIVHVSSGVASGFLKKQDPASKALYSKPDLTQEELDAKVQADLAAGNTGFGSGYALSKCALSALALVQAQQYKNLKVVSLSPGFIDTKMTAGGRGDRRPCVLCACVYIHRYKDTYLFTYIPHT